MKVIIGGGLFNGIGYFELTTKNGNKANVLSRLNTARENLVSCTKLEEEYTERLYKYLLNKDVNSYPFYDGDSEIKIIGINKYQPKCCYFTLEELKVSKVSDGGYIVYANKYSKTADAGYYKYVRTRARNVI